MRDPILRRLVDTLGWIAYLHVIGGGRYPRELLKISPTTAGGGRTKRARPGRAASKPPKVLRLEDYRARRRRRSASVDAATRKVA